MSTQVHPTIAAIKGHFNAGETLGFSGTIVAQDDTTTISQTADGRLVITGNFELDTNQGIDIDLTEAQPTPPSTPVTIVPPAEQPPAEAPTDTTVNG